MEAQDGTPLTPCLPCWPVQPLTSPWCECSGALLAAVWLKLQPFVHLTRFEVKTSEGGLDLALYDDGVWHVVGHTEGRPSFHYSVMGSCMRKVTLSKILKAIAAPGYKVELGHTSIFAPTCHE